MAVGEKVWFPEMLEELKKAWKPGMSWSEIVTMLRYLEQRCTEIKTGRNIASNFIPCSSCGGGVGQATKISMKLLLLTLRNNLIISDFQFGRLERDWLVYKRKNGLNGYAEKE